MFQQRERYRECDHDVSSESGLEEKKGSTVLQRRKLPYSSRKEKTGTDKRMSGIKRGTLHSSKERVTEEKRGSGLRKKRGEEKTTRQPELAFASERRGEKRQHRKRKRKRKNRKRRKEVLRTFRKGRGKKL